MNTVEAIKVSLLAGACMYGASYLVQTLGVFYFVMLF